MVVSTLMAILRNVPCSTSATQTVRFWAKVRPIFYGKTRVSIDVPHSVLGRNSVALAIRFFEDHPHALHLIRNFEFEVEESYDDNLQGYL